MSTFSEWKAGWMSAGVGDRYWARVLRPPRLGQSLWGWRDGWMEGLGGCMRKWGMEHHLMPPLVFLFKVSLKRWHHRRGRGCVLEGESTRCFSSLVPADTHISNLASSLYKCFFHCPMLHFLPLEVQESFPQMSLWINFFCCYIRLFQHSLYNKSAIFQPVTWKHVTHQRCVCAAEKHKRIRATSPCMPHTVTSTWNKLDETKCWRSLLN